MITACAECPAFPAFRPAEVGVATLDLQAEQPAGDQVILGYHLSQRVNPVVRKRLWTEVPPQCPLDDVVDSAHCPALYPLSSVTPHTRGLVSRRTPLLAPHHLHPIYSRNAPA